MTNLPDKIIEPLFRVLRIQYNIFLISLIVLTAIGCFGIISFRFDSKELITQLQSFSVLLTLAVIPTTLRFFGKKMSRIREMNNWTEKIILYKKLTFLRLLILGSVTAINIFLYFPTQTYSFLLCAGMCVAASLFCIPSIKKIEYDLIPEETDEESSEGPINSPD